MQIIDQLRYDINQAVQYFSYNRTLSNERQQNIREITRILEKNKPIKVRKKLIDYVNQMSTGFFSYIPFLEVNKFQAALQSVLSLPRYRETEFLKTLLLESDYNYLLDETFNKNSVPFRLKQALKAQSVTVTELTEEIVRLKKENAYFISVISDLNNENKALHADKTKLCQTNKALEVKFENIEQQYQTACEENQLLRKQLAKYSLTHQETQGEDVEKQQYVSIFSQRSNKQASRHRQEQDAFKPKSLSLRV
jgi:hypothetical protein